MVTCMAKADITINMYLPPLRLPAAPSSVHPDAILRNALRAAFIEAVFPFAVVE